jgi:hypothetical protein
LVINSLRFAIDLLALCADLTGDDGLFSINILCEQLSQVVE